MPLPRSGGEKGPEGMLDEEALQRRQYKPVGEQAARKGREEIELQEPGRNRICGRAKASDRCATSHVLRGLALRVLRTGGSRDGD